MKITSPVFQNNEPVPIKYTCLGPNISPPLTFQDIPEKTKSLILLIEDADTEPEPWVHWLVFNIPPDVIGFESEAVPEEAVEGLCNNNSFGYEGPCPEYFADTHRFHFRLLALDIKLDISSASDKQAVLKAAEGHVLEEDVLTGTADGELE